jgi:hypothetical protein
LRRHHSLIKAVRVNARGKTKKKIKIPALSSGIVTMPMEYLLGEVQLTHKW